ncbi:MAG: hypothetical protein ACK4LB_13145 [Spirosomataceae bacterium]
MTSFRVRPRFQKQVTYTPLQLVERFSEQLAEYPSSLEGKVYPTHGLIRVKPEDQHYWSPQLQISFEPTPTGTIVRGMYGPHPSVWAAFMFGYAVSGITVLFLGIYGWVKYSLHQETTLLWAVPIGLIFWAILYLISQMGQKIGAEQTFTIHHFVEDVLDDRVSIS